MAFRENYLPIAHFDTNSNGVMTVKAIARHVGPLRYRGDGGDRVEFVPPDLIRGYGDDGRPHIAALAGVPVTNEHPVRLIREDANLKQMVTVGEVKPRIKVYKDDRAEVEFEVFDSRTQDEIRRGIKKGVSVGYQCGVVRQDGEWQGIKYDCIQTAPWIPDHLAVVASPRAASALITKFDSDSIGDLDVAYQLVEERTDSSELFQVEIGDSPFYVPRDLYIALHNDGLIEHRDRGSGKGKKCPGGYWIAASKNCRGGSSAAKTSRETKALEQIGMGSSARNKANAAAKKRMKKGPSITPDVSDMERSALVDKALKKKANKGKRSEAGKKAAATRKTKKEVAAIREIGMGASAKRMGNLGAKQRVRSGPSITPDISDQERVALVEKALKKEQRSKAGKKAAATRKSKKEAAMVRAASLPDPDLAATVSKKSKRKKAA